MTSGDCARIRKSGAVKLIVIGVLAVVALRAAGLVLDFIALDDPDDDIPLSTIEWLSLVFPVAFGLCASIEVVTGVEFTRFAKKWSLLASWQRGLLGFGLVVLAALASGAISMAVS